MNNESIIRDLVRAGHKREDLIKLSTIELMNLVKTDEKPPNTCEQCGGEMTSKLAGDESYLHCNDCGYMDPS